MVWQKNNILLTILLTLAALGAGMFWGGHDLGNEAGLPKASLTDSLASQGTQDGCVTIEDAQNFAGDEICVRGALLKVFVSKSKTVFLDFCENYNQCPFTAVIFKSAAAKFDNLKEYEGKIVEIRGMVKTYKGKPEIILDKPEQIKIVQ
ncbi:MAG: hypothetical protein WC449_00645 [Candidatus Paceibacterota bacterium]